MDIVYGTLTISRVSGLIALGNSVVIFTIPLLLAVLLIYHVDRTRSASSWSVLARQIQSSAWPSVLRTDSVAGQHVHWSITTVAYLNLALAFLGVVSGVITPLGLGEEIKATAVRDARFQYAPDFSSFGNGTIARPDMPMSRDCMILSDQCPGAFVPGATMDQNTTDPKPNPNATATTKIPQNITDMFRSATDGSTVASSLDIQYRSWMPSRSKYFNDNEPYAIGRYKHIDMLLSQEAYIVVEGIIVDTMTGGIGYRNHTVPAGLNYGGEWDEDILWIEPDISCADTNLSLEVVLDEPLAESPQYRSLRLIDRGGFADLSTTSPYNGWPNLTYSAPDTWERANRTAWLSNLLTAIVFNITDTEDYHYGLNVSTGQQYNISRNDSSFGISPALGVRSGFMDVDWFAGSYAASFINGSLTDRNGDLLVPEEDYPDLLAIALFDEVNGLCRGQYNDVSGANNYNVECGYLFGAGSRLDNGQPLMEEVGSQWEQRIHTCAGAVKASIKSVTFSMNESLVLENLVAKQVRDKTYKSKEDEPLWAVEDWWHPGSEGAYSAPLWGIVNDSYQDTPGYNFTRSPTLFLPSTSSLREISNPKDMLAAAQAPSGALQEVISGFDAFYTVTKGVFPAYSGEHSFSLMNKWRELSKTAEGSAKILRLVWTDIMASGTVGTNLRASPADGSALEDDDREVNAYSRRLTYDMRYAIPALLLLAMWLSLLVIGFIASVIQRHPFRKLRTLLNDTSMGRYAASALDPASKGMLRATSHRWLDGVGYIPLKLGEEPSHRDFASYRSPSESGGTEKNLNGSFVQPLMRNDSLEGVTRDPESRNESNKAPGQ